MFRSICSSKCSGWYSETVAKYWQSAWSHGPQYDGKVGVMHQQNDAKVIKLVFENIWYRLCLHCREYSFLIFTPTKQNFCKSFNGKTSAIRPGVPMQVRLIPTTDKNYKFYIQTPTASWFIKRVCDLRLASPTNSLNCWCGSFVCRLPGCFAAQIDLGIDIPQDSLPGKKSIILLWSSAWMRILHISLFKRFAANWFPQYVRWIKDINCLIDKWL